MSQAGLKKFDRSVGIALTSHVLAIVEVDRCIGRILLENGLEEVFGFVGLSGDVCKNSLLQDVFSGEVRVGSSFGRDRLRSRCGWVRLAFFSKRIVRGVSIDGKTLLRFS